MKCFFKTVLIVGLVGIGTVSLAHIVLGKARTQGAIKALQGMAQNEVDKLIATEEDMRGQLEKLRAEYPRQIAMLRSQASEVERRLAAVERDNARARDILSLCEADLKEIHAARPEAVTGAIAFRGSRYKPAQTEVLVERIEQTRELYTTRLEDNEQEAKVLKQELEQLQSDITAMRTEQEEFETQYQSLLREIERVSRNEKAIRLAESRGARGGERHDEAMSTLGQVKASLERARIEQEERLRAARGKPKSLDYEARVRAMEAQHAREARRAVQPVPESPEKADDAPENISNAEEVAEAAFALK